jgi:hypothetical protein
METDNRRRSTDEEHAQILSALDAIKLELMGRKHLDEKVLSLDKAINGNGTPGIRTDVQIIKDQLGRLNWASGLVIAGLLADLLTRLLSH